MLFVGSTESAGIMCPAINNYNYWIIYDKRNYARVQDADLCTFRGDNRSSSADRYVAKLKLLSEKSRVTLLKRMTIFLSQIMTIKFKYGANKSPLA